MEIRITQELAKVESVPPYHDMRFELFIDGKKSASFWLGDKDTWFEETCRSLGQTVANRLQINGQALIDADDPVERKG